MTDDLFDYDLEVDLDDVEEEDDDPFDLEGERIANDFEGEEGDLFEEEEWPDNSVPNTEFLERSMGTMPCCGAPRPPSLGDDEPCPNCGAI